MLIRRVRRVIDERARGSCTPTCSRRRTCCWPTWPTQGPCASSAIADSFGIDKGAISRQVQHLVDLGLVDRTPDPADGRATLLSASDEARAGSTRSTRHRRK